jgi:hypothetical protein
MADAVSARAEALLRGFYELRLKYGLPEASEPNDDDRLGAAPPTASTAGELKELHVPSTSKMNLDSPYRRQHDEQEHAFDTTRTHPPPLTRVTHSDAKTLSERAEQENGYARRRHEAHDSAGTATDAMPSLHAASREPLSERRGPGPAEAEPTRYTAEAARIAELEASLQALDESKPIMLELSPHTKMAVDAPQTSGRHRPQVSAARRGQPGA